MTSQIYSRDHAKAFARLLCAASQREGTPISHSAALEVIAHRHGYADWNTLSAALASEPRQPIAIGQRIAGQYLKRPITGQVVRFERVKDSTNYLIVIDLDEAVDVVDSALFSNYRRKIQTTVSKHGIAQQKTRDGVPHLIVAPSE